MGHATKMSLISEDDSHLLLHLAPHSLDAKPIPCQLKNKLVIRFFIGFIKLNNQTKDKYNSN